MKILLNYFFYMFQFLFNVPFTSDPFFFSFFYFSFLILFELTLNMEDVYLVQKIYNKYIQGDLTSIYIPFCQFLPIPSSSHFDSFLISFPRICLFCKTKSYFFVSLSMRGHAKSIGLQLACFN